jgi:hypothetical protein
LLLRKKQGGEEDTRSVLDAVVVTNATGQECSGNQRPLKISFVKGPVSGASIQYLLLVEAIGDSFAIVPDVNKHGGGERTT